MRKTYKKYEEVVLGFKYLLLCVSKLAATMKFPELRRYVQKCTHWRKWQKWQLIAKIAKL